MNTVRWVYLWAAWSLTRWAQGLVLLWAVINKGFHWSAGHRHYAHEREDGLALPSFRASLPGDRRHAAAPGVSAHAQRRWETLWRLLSLLMLNNQVKLSEDVTMTTRFSPHHWCQMWCWQIVNWTLVWNIDCVVWNELLFIFYFITAHHFAWNCFGTQNWTFKSVIIDIFHSSGIRETPTHCRY